jgi:ATP-binding cassette subfamily C protein
MLDDLRKLYALLTPRERRLGAAVVAVMLGAAGLQALTAGSLYPFLSAVSDPSALESGRLGWVYDTLGFGGERQFLVVAGLVVLVLVVVSNVALAVSHWARLRFQWGVNHTLSVRLLRSYLGRDYARFLEENTAELHKNILTEATEITNGLLQPVLMMLSNGALALAMLALLLAVDPMATAVVLGITGGGYAVAYLFIRRRLETLGDRYAEANRERYKTTAEAFGGIKDVKVLGREAHFLDAFRPASRAFTRTLAARRVYASLPKYAIEALAMGSLLALLLLLLVTGRPVALIVPIMGTFAFAGYRMMPAFRDILGALASFRFTEEIFGAIEEALEGGGRPPAPIEGTEEAEPLPFQRELALEGVTYRYPGVREPALRDVSLTIPRDAAVAFAGRTGAGKTTIIDLLLGLLSPTEGRFLVDGVEVTPENVHRWRANLGYVPQDIYMADTTVARNIAYGIPGEEIDRGAVERAARIAHIHEFVSGELPDGYDTLIGERGVRLSGGQRQRIGIARALYHDPPVLVLDEATSEIDGATEASITRAIRELHGEKTLIVVAHRLGTIRNCDRIHLVEGGRIVESGTFEELLAGSGRFEELRGESLQTAEM